MSLLLALVILSCETKTQSYKNDIPFNIEKWKAGNLRAKGKMTDNLLADSILIGKTKSEVLKMLGEPDQQTSSRIYYTVDPGIKYMNGAWTYWLSIDFDTITGKVKEVRLAD